MWYEAEITIPAGTLEANPVEAQLDISYGIIHHVIIEAAPGCHREAAIRIYYQEHQVYPTNPEQDIALDGVPRNFTDRLPVLTDPLVLVIRGYAPSATYAHTYRVGIGIMSPETFPEYRADTGLVSKIAKLLGIR